jgi:hypothetical protein
MFELLNHLLDAPVANILILAGLMLLGVAATGRISGKIEPGTGGRILCAVLGLILVVAGVQFHTIVDNGRKENPSKPAGHNRP